MLTAWISVSSEIFKKPKFWKILFFPMLFPYYENLIFLCLGKFIHFRFILNILKSPSLWNCLCFPIFFCNMVCRFLHILDIACVLLCTHCMHAWMHWMHGMHCRKGLIILLILFIFHIYLAIFSGIYTFFCNFWQTIMIKIK